MEWRALPDFRGLQDAAAVDGLVPPVSETRAQPVGEAQSAAPGLELIEHGLDTIDGVERMALSVDPRDGRLRVFLPAMEDLEDYLQLVAAAEKSAKALGMPVQYQGLRPTADPRMNVIRGAPDPGGD